MRKEKIRVAILHVSTLLEILDYAEHPDVVSLLLRFQPFLRF
jgi:hypothetical protein